MIRASERIRLCLLGAGRWGARYIDTIRAERGVTLARLASRNPLSNEFADCEVTPDWRAAVAAPGIDAVIIATPPAVHFDMALAALEAGLPVLIEKPITLTVDEARQIEAKAAACGTMAMVSNIHLHNPAYQELKRQLPRIGAIFELHWHSGNSGPYRDIPPLWDWGPHGLSVFLDIMEASPTAIASTCLVERIVDGGKGGNYHLKLDFNGVPAQIVLGNLMDTKTCRLEVTGSRASLIYDDVARTLALKTDGTQTLIPYPRGRPLANQIKAFEDAVRAGKPCDNSLKQGRVITEILTRCDSVMVRA